MHEFKLLKVKLPEWPTWSYMTHTSICGEGKIGMTTATPFPARRPDVCKVWLCCGTSPRSPCSSAPPSPLLLAGGPRPSAAAPTLLPQTSGSLEVGLQTELPFNNAAESQNTASPSPFWQDHRAKYRLAHPWLEATGPLMQYMKPFIHWRLIIHPCCWVLIFFFSGSILWYICAKHFNLSLPCTAMVARQLKLVCAVH